MPNVEHPGRCWLLNTSEFAICVEFQTSVRLLEAEQTRRYSLKPWSSTQNRRSQHPRRRIRQTRGILTSSRCIPRFRLNRTRSLRNGPIASNRNFSFHCSHFVLPRRNPNIYTSRLRLNASSYPPQTSTPRLRTALLPPRSLLVHLFYSSTFSVREWPLLHFPCSLRTLLYSFLLSDTLVLPPDRVCRRTVSRAFFLLLFPCLLRPAPGCLAHLS
mmetsp:Transcript_2409/g.7392  ORF Transcript_2409/g.7392 Transcript_2409/m.7392 type:complete len:215 (+) Transcript_2409:545-1189(+)